MLTVPSRTELTLDGSVGDADGHDPHDEAELRRVSQYEAAPKARPVFGVTSGYLGRHRVEASIGDGEFRPGGYWVVRHAA